MNAAATWNGTENANVVSCEIGEKGFEVDGRDRTEVSLGKGTACASGAVCGELLERDLGNTSVINAMCSAACLIVSLV